jgi:hypothetical protein
MKRAGGGSCGLAAGAAASLRVEVMAVTLP